jgi:hypothetical protein
MDGNCNDTEDTEVMCIILIHMTSIHGHRSGTFWVNESWMKLGQEEGLDKQSQRRGSSLLRAPLAQLRHRHLAPELTATQFLLPPWYVSMFPSLKSSVLQLFYCGVLALAHFFGVLGLRGF